MKTIRKKHKEPGIIPALRGRDRWISEFVAKLIYRVSSMTSRSSARNPGLNKQTNKCMRKSEYDLDCTQLSKTITAASLPTQPPYLWQMSSTKEAVRSLYDLLDKFPITFQNEQFYKSKSLPWILRDRGIFFWLLKNYINKLKWWQLGTHGTSQCH